jgi:hypothetical protein
MNITPQSTISLNIVAQNNVSLTINPATPANVEFRSGDTTVDNLTVIDNLTDISNFYELDLANSSLGDWFVVELQNTSTSGIEFPSTTEMTGELRDDIGRLIVNTQAQTSTSNHNPNADRDLTKHDYLFSWTGSVASFDPDFSSIIVGFMRTHGGEDEGESLERVVGFIANRTTETWHAAIWRTDPGNEPPYHSVYDEDTNASIYDPTSLQVVVCNKGTRGAFYLNGDLVSVQDDNMPVPTDQQTGTAEPGTQGARLFCGYFLRNLYLEGTDTVTVFPKLSTTFMTCREYKLDSVLTTEFGGVGASGVAGGDLTGTYPNPQIAAGAVGTTELATNAVTSDKITNFSVTSTKIATGAVTTAKIEDAGVTPDKIGSGLASGLIVLINDEDDNASIWANIPNFTVNYASSVPQVTLDNIDGIEAGGDLQGTYPNPTVHRIKGIDIHNNPDNLDLFQFKTSNNKLHWVSYAEAGLVTTGDLIGNFDPTDPTSPVWFFDDFIPQNTEAGEVGTHNWNLTNVTATNANSEANHPGNAIIRCSSTINTVGTLSLASGSASNCQVSFGDWTEMTIVFKDLETDTTCQRQFGLMDTWSSMTPTNGVFIRKTTTGSAWTAVCRASSTETVSGTNLFTQDTNWHKVKIVKNGSSIDFYVDGASSPTTSISTNVPASSTQMNIVYQNQPNAGSLVRRTQIDFISFKTGALTR